MLVVAQSGTQPRTRPRTRRPCAPWRPSIGSVPCAGGTPLRFRNSAISARDFPFASCVRTCARQPQSRLLHQEWENRSLGDEPPAIRFERRVVVARGRPLIVRGPDRIESAAPLVVVALRHLAPQGEELAALGHPHKDISIFHAELAELVRDRLSATR